MKQKKIPEDMLIPRTHGGKRKGAGRKRRMDEGAHTARPEIDGGRHPLHITVRLRDGLPGLRNSKALKRLQTIMKEARNFGLRVNHFSILSNHIHMIAEVDDVKALKRGMMSFNGRLGRWLRQQATRQSQTPLQRIYPRGFFKGRYHVQVITNARQMKNVLKYVLLNASRHFRKCAYIDEFSSGASFHKWSELLKERFNGLIQAQVMSLQETANSKSHTSSPTTKMNKDAKSKDAKNLLEGITSPITWLGRTGWQRG